jgi:hypothetical protein
VPGGLPMTMMSGIEWEGVVRIPLKINSNSGIAIGNHTGSKLHIVFILIQGPKNYNYIRLSDEIKLLFTKAMLSAKSTPRITEIVNNPVDGSNINIKYDDIQKMFHLSSYEGTDTIIIDEPTMRKIALNIENYTLPPSGD